MCRLFFFLSLIFLSTSLDASENETLLAQANKAYQDEKYQEAIDLYESVLVKGQHSASLYYNLGNAYYRQNMLGKAILNYEKAKLYAPHNSDIKHNLLIAKNRTFDNIVPVPLFFLSVWWKNTYQLLSPMLWAILGILFLLGAVGGIGVWLIFQNRKHKQSGFYGAIAASVLGILFLLLGNSYHNAQVNSKMAIITAKQVDFKNGADELSNTISTLHEGVKIQRIEIINGWQKVRLENGEVGWLQMDAFENI
jgi:tetratricopeptide (TPR) repeat protein